MRLLVYITVGYIIGIIWGLYLKISIVSIFFCGLIIYKNTKINKKAILLLVVFALISNAQIKILERKHQTLYQEQENIQIVGTIISEKEETTYKAKYTIKVETVNGEDKFKNTYLILYTPKKSIIEYGNKVEIIGTYEKAKQNTNYKMFNYNEYLKTKNIYGIVNAEKIKKVKEKNISQILISFNTLRTQIKKRLKNILGEEAKIAIGILLRRHIRNIRRNSRRIQNK